MIHVLHLKVTVVIIITTRFVFSIYNKSVDDAFSSFGKCLAIGRKRGGNGQLIMKRHKNEQHQYVEDEMNGKYN